MHAYGTRPLERTAGRSRPGWLGRSIVSGFAATGAMFLCFLAAYLFVNVVATVPLRETRSSEQLRIWLFNLTHNSLVDTAAANAYTVSAFYVAGGLVWAAIYGGLFEPRLPGPAWARGALFSLIPGTLSVLVFLPLVGGGTLGYGIGAGPLPIIGNLLLHLAYGAVLGHLYGPFGDIDATTLEGQVAAADASAMLGAERFAALGLVLGLIGGAVGGVAAALSASVRPEETVLGEPAAELVLATALLGAALGGLVGSFLGMSGGSQA